jgi:hypothetical protein
MRAIRERLTQELVWVQPKWFTDTYELRPVEGEKEDEPLARLTLQRRARTQATVAAGSYRFQQRGVWRPKVLVT